MNTESVKTSKELVHKHREENVFICNLRRGIDREIDSHMMETYYLTSLNDHDRNTLLRYYKKITAEMCDDKQERECYVLRSLPYMVESSVVKEHLKRLPHCRENAYLRKIYRRNPKTKRYHLRPSVSERDEIQILTTFGLKDLYITDREKAVLSDIFEKIEYIPRSNTFYSNLIIDTSHSYFFEHPTEHIPGMMIIEAARQMLTACSHKFGKVPLKNHHFILLDLQTRFLNYMELNYPVRLEATLEQLFTDNKGVWNDFQARVEVIQRNQMAATLLFQASIVSNRVFKRMRTTKEKTEENPRFKPRSGVHHHLSLRDGNGKKRDGVLKNISATGFQVTMLEHIDTENTGDSFEFFLYFEKIGIIHGTCTLRWHEMRDELVNAGFHIERMDATDRFNMEEDLKRQC